MRLTCVGCRCESSDVDTNTTLAEVRRATGWATYFDQGNGLESVWVCATCNARVVEASRLLRSVFGNRLPTINMARIAQITATEGKTS